MIPHQQHPKRRTLPPALRAPQPGKACVCRRIPVADLLRPCVCAPGGGVAAAAFEAVDAMAGHGQIRRGPDWILDTDFGVTTGIPRIRLSGRSLGADEFPALLGRISRIPISVLALSAWKHASARGHLTWIYRQNQGRCVRMGTHNALKMLVMGSPPGLPIAIFCIIINAVLSTLPPWCPPGHHLMSFSRSIACPARRIRSTPRV